MYILLSCVKEESHSLVQLSQEQVFLPEGFSCLTKHVEAFLYAYIHESNRAL